MTRAALLLALLFAHPAGAAASSDGTLARSARLPFAIERAAEDSSVLRVSRVEEDSAAARSGLRIDDVILRIDGRPVDRPAQARRILEHGTGGRRVTLEIRRGDTSHQIGLTLPPAPLEDIPGVLSRYGSLRTPDGLRLRTILTRPEGSTGRLPALYFVQWLSCDSIEYPLNPDDHGWQQMLQLLASRSGIAMMRTEKAGIGDSEGDCEALDYDTELAHHRLALRQLAGDPGIDPERIVIFGASMGGNMAALLAAELEPAGLVIWGTAIKSWFEHLVEFNRRYLEYSGRPAPEISPLVNRQISFLEAFLIEGRSPAEIAADDPALGDVWPLIRGSAGATLYGRPYRYHQQAQAKDWAGAVAAVDAPTLVLYGEYDWYEALDDHVLIARLVERRCPGNARLVVVPGMDHHFSVYPDADATFRREGGFVAPQRPVMEIVSFLNRVILAPRPLTGPGSSAEAAAPSSSASGSRCAPPPVLP
jgi:pimeloyl-ACP methyl ester carboxylesterase